MGVDVSYVESSISVAAPPKAVYELATDMERYPQYMTDVEKVVVLERLPGFTLTDWTTSVEGIPICWKEEDHFDAEGLRITYRLTEGDLDKFEGEWRFEPQKGGTRVSLTVDFDFGMPTLAELLGPVLDMKVRENSQMMLEGLKSLAESAESGTRTERTAAPV